MTITAVAESPKSQSISTNANLDFPVVLVSFGEKMVTLNFAGQLHIKDEAGGSNLLINAASFSGTYKHDGGELTIEYDSRFPSFSVHYTGSGKVSVHNGLEGTDVTIRHEGSGTITATSSKKARLFTICDEEEGDVLTETSPGYVISNKQGGQLIASGPSLTCCDE